MAGTPLPKTSNPAMRAVTGVGVTCLEDLTRLTEAELLALHGVGPKAIRIWKQALAERGLALKSAPC
ncbi:MAG: DNA-binding protein [Anaerolineae bacterium]